MLRSMNDLENYSIRATDGTIGHVKDFYFDDAAWVMRYLVVETDTWLSSRKVLISPISIGKPDWTAKVLPVSITTEQVKNSPDIDTEKPVSRQHEMRYLGYYGYPYYWGNDGIWGGGIYPGMMLRGLGSDGSHFAYREAQAQQAREAAEVDRQQDADPHLRSGKAVIGYHIQATDGEIGHVQDLLVDEQTWAIRYIVADTSNWWLGHQVLVAPQWIKDVRWPGATVSVDLTRQAVKDAPPYDSSTQLDRGQETGIYKHYGRRAYWAEETKGEAIMSSH
jgi:hypothetical protein